MKSVVNNQRGGIVAFMVVGVVLALLLAGGIYASKNQGRRAALNPAPSTTTSETASKPEPQTTTKETPKDTTPPTSSSNPSTPTPTPQTPSQTAKPGSGSGPIATTGPSSIADTGPSDVWVSALAISAVMAGAVAYRRSILQMRSSALK